MNVSSVKNLNGETFSAVQDATLTDVVQTNSGNWNEISAYELASANYLTAHQDLSDYATTADLALKQDTLTFDYDENDKISAINNSAIAGGGGGGTGDYVPLSATKVLIGSANVTDNYSYQVFVQGKNNSGIGYSVFAQGIDCYADTESLAQGQGSSALTGSIAQGIDLNSLSGNYAENYSMAQGQCNTAIENSLSRGKSCYASGNSIANGSCVVAKNCSLALGTAQLNTTFPSATTYSINLGAGSAQNGSIHLGIVGGATQGSIATNTSASKYSLALADDSYFAAKANNGSIAVMNPYKQYYPVVAQNNSIGLGASALNGSLALGCGETYNDDNYASAHSIAVGKGVSATNYGLALGKYNKVTSAAIVVGNGAGSNFEAKDTFIVFHDGSVSAAGKISANGVELGAGGGGGVTGNYVSGYNVVKNGDIWYSTYTGCNVNGDITISVGSWSQEQGYQPWNTYSVLNAASSINSKLNSNATDCKIGSTIQIKGSGCCFAQGVWCSAYDSSMAQGSGCYASSAAQAFGNHVSANKGMAIGSYNDNVSASFVIGNGTDSATRSDSFVIDYDGNVSAMGDIKASGMSLQTLWDLVAAHSASWS